MSEEYNIRLTKPQLRVLAKKDEIFSTINDMKGAKVLINIEADTKKEARELADDFEGDEDLDGETYLGVTVLVDKRMEVVLAKAKIAARKGTMLLGLFSVSSLAGRVIGKVLVRPSVPVIFPLAAAVALTIGTTHYAFRIVGE